MIERRRDNRVTAYLPAKWEGMSGIHEVRLEDISLGGCFVNSNFRVEINQPVSLEVEIRPEWWIRLRGEVKNYQPGVGFGVTFSLLTEEGRAVLRQLI